MPCESIVLKQRHVCLPLGLAQKTRLRTLNGKEASRKTHISSPVATCALGGPNPAKLSHYPDFRCFFFVGCLPELEEEEEEEEESAFFSGGSSSAAGPTREVSLVLPLLFARESKRWQRGVPVRPPAGRQRPRVQVGRRGHS